MPAGRLRRHGSMQQLLLELAPPPPPTLENFSPGKNGAALKALKETLEDGERFVFLWGPGGSGKTRSEEHTSELQSHSDLVCRLLLEKKKKKQYYTPLATTSMSG